jgi:hypothetical protein
MTGRLQEELVGQFVGADPDPSHATCSFHDGGCTMSAGDRLQLEVELMDSRWSPLFHRCPAHAVESFPEEHSVRGVEQALVAVTLAPTGAYLPTSGEYAPEALTLSDIEVLDRCPAAEGRCSPLEGD